MSQSELAQMLGISRSAVSSYENGTRSPNHDMLLKLAVLFNVSTDFLLGNETRQPQANPTDELLKDFKQLLSTSDLSTEIKSQIMDELKDYLQWKLVQASIHSINK